jgi:hypothetical protein
MLKDGFVLTVICVIVVAAIFAWWTTSSRHTYGAPSESRFLEPEPAPAPPAVAKTIHRPLHLAPEPLIARPEVAVSPSPIAAVSPAVVEHDPPPFPSVEQIAAGLHGDAITGKYGNPALSAMTSTGGHVVETFIYARDRGRSSTVIRLEDGKVAAAFSRTQPLAPTGLSAPRRWHNE